MTDEYINKKDVVNIAVMMQTHLWTREQTYNAIFCLPSADAVPVRHGRWIEKTTCVGWAGGGYWRCSCCGFCYSFGAYHEMNESNYCPNCGAKMDEEE